MELETVLPSMALPRGVPDFDDAFYDENHPCSNCGKWIKVGRGKRLVAAGVDYIYVCDTHCAKDLARFAQDCVRWPNGNRVVPSGPPVAR